MNDGSRDGTIALLLELHRADPRVAVVDLSRNFGKEVAMSAGLDHAHGDAVIVIDADLQDPPELMPEMVAAWQDGCDVVLMRRRSRAEESWLKRATARAFYRTLRTLAAIDIPENVGDFRLLSRRAVDAVRALPERSRFMKGIFAWIGFPSRDARLRPREPRRRPHDVELLAPVELRARGHHVVLRHAAQARELHRVCVGRGRVRLRRVRRRQDASSTATRSAAIRRSSCSCCSWAASS